MPKYFRTTLTNENCIHEEKYQGADKSLARPTSRCILFDGENISFDASFVIYINTTNILPIVIINMNIKIFCHCSLFPSWLG